MNDFTHSELGAELVRQSDGARARAQDSLQDSLREAARKAAARRFTGEPPTCFGAADLMDDSDGSRS